MTQATRNVVIRRSLLHRIGWAAFYVATLALSGYTIASILVGWATGG